MLNPALTTLTHWLAKAHYDFLLVPTEDAFLSEYTPAHAKRLAWLTGFTGSAGMAVISKDGEHHLFTDGRYQTQARIQLACSFTVHHTAHTPFNAWLAQMKGANIAYDPWLHSIHMIEQWKKIATQHSHRFIALESQPIDHLWRDQPMPAPSRPYHHPLNFAGWSAAEKLAMIQQHLRNHDLEYYLLTDCPSLCWLLNIRANDVPCTPLLLAYALISLKDGITVWADIDKESQAIFSELGIPCSILPLHELILPGEKIGLTATQTPAIFAHLAASYKDITNPCLLPKACKHTVERDGARQAHLQDAIALCTAFSRLSEASDELQVADLLLATRMLQPGFVGPSFPTIVGFRDHGAIIHYQAEAATAHSFKGNGLLLIDSGGQYHSGTTDITRTFTLGNPTEQQCFHYTLVLKGHVQLAMAVFPEGTTGAHLDTLARLPLWQNGLDYAHGTGHGVGSFLSVHEGPQSISQRSTSLPLKVGMILSNEPGYYLEDQYGIRIENLMLVTAHTSPGFQCFETLTLVPYCRSLILPSLLTDAEKSWINDYHCRIFSTLKPYIQEPAVLSWLEHQTQRLE